MIIYIFIFLSLKLNSIINVSVCERLLERMRRNIYNLFMILFFFQKLNVKCLTKKHASLPCGLPLCKGSSLKFQGEIRGRGAQGIAIRSKGKGTGTGRMPHFAFSYGSMKEERKSCQERQ